MYINDDDNVCDLLLKIIEKSLYIYKKIKLGRYLHTKINEICE